MSLSHRQESDDIRHPDKRGRRVTPPCGVLGRREAYDAGGGGVSITFGALHRDGWARAYVSKCAAWLLQLGHGKQEEILSSRKRRSKRTVAVQAFEDVE